MDKSTRTAIGTLLQTAHKHNLPYTYLENSVMNKLLNVFPDLMPPADFLPYAQYIAIGTGALGVQFGANNRKSLYPLPHDPQHTGLYEQIPFVMRPITSDLNGQQRLRFRMRQIKTVNNVAYACYYLRVMDLSTTQAKLELRSLQEGNIVSEPWTPRVEHQKPSPPAINPGQVLATGDDYIASTAQSRFQLTASDMDELINVSNILYGADNGITISELAICSGMDESVSGDFNGVPVSYTDAIGVQITDFVMTMLPVLYQRGGASINMDTGSVEPLLALS